MASLKAQVLVIGAGPVGSYISLRLSKAGFEVVCLEEHPEPGRPVQCAGLINPSVFNFPYLSTIRDKVVDREIIGADIFSPSGHLLPLRGHTVKALSIDRAAFDQEIFRSSVKAGTKFLLSQKAVEIKGSNDDSPLVRTKGFHGDLDIGCDVLIGSEGPSSITGAWSGLGRPSEIIPGMNVEAEVNDCSIPKDIVGVLTGSKVAKGFFAWAIPSRYKNSLRLGTATSDPSTLHKGYADLMADPRLKRFIGLEGGNDLCISEVSRSFGAIPMGVIRSPVRGRTVLLGDSAGMAKPSSGGGIYPGLFAADLLARTIEGTSGTTDRALQDFALKWRRGYGRELERSMVFRRVLHEITDNEIDIALERMSRDDIVELINEKGDIDHPVSLGLSLLKHDPGLLGLIPRFLPYLRKVL